MVWQETALLALLLAAMVSMGFDRGFEDPGGELWMVMLGVQSLPYAATFVTAGQRCQAQQVRTLVAEPVQSALIRPDLPRRSRSSRALRNEAALVDEARFRASGGTVFPGLRIFFGSKACFSARIASSSSLDL